MKHELLPCPFCGADAETYLKNTGAGHGEMYQDFGVKCTSCAAKVGLSTYTENFKAKAIAGWNSRAVEKGFTASEKTSVHGAKSIETKEFAEVLGRLCARYEAGLKDHEAKRIFDYLWDALIDRIDKYVTHSVVSARRDYSGKEGAMKASVEYLMAATHGSRHPSTFIESVSDLFDRLIELREDELPMPLTDAVRYADHWRNNKLLGGDPYEVSKVLLSEIERMQPEPAVQNLELVIARLETISAGNTDDPRTLASEALVCARAVLAAATKATT